MDPKLLQIRWANSRDDALSRRRFLTLVSAAAASGACSPEPPEQILPYTEHPVEVVPGVSQFYATSILIEGYATGLLGETREGRPIKMEGNPQHPASLGATSVFHQAVVLQLYDPDRARTVLEWGLPAAWESIERVLARPAAPSGAGLRVLLEPTSSPLVHGLVTDVKARYPEAKFTFYAPFSGRAVGDATAASFGSRLTPQYDFGLPDVIVALDSNFLANPYELGAARRFAARRHVRPGDAGMNRLYVVEPSVTVTGMMADERLARPARRVPLLAAALLEVMPNRAPLPAAVLAGLSAQLDDDERRFVAALGRDLRARPPGRTLVVAGERQPRAVHVLVHALNHALGNLGRALTFTEQPVPDDAGDQDLAALSAEMHAGQVDTLLVLGPNPVYDAPADLDWARALRQVKTSVYAGLYQNETGLAARFFGPLAHPLEAWGDGRSHDGTLSFAQPLIRTMHGGRTVTELLALLAGQTPAGDYTRLRVRFGAQHGEHLTLDASAAERLVGRDPNVEERWKQALARGFVAGSAFPPRAVEPSTAAVAAALAELARAPVSAGLELDFLPSPTLLDGRFSNLSWLLELPTPIEKLTWDNAAFMSPATAERLGVPSVEREDDHPLVELTRAGRRVRLPAVVLPEHADDAITVWVGYGRSGQERLARGVGFDVYPLRTTDALHFAGGVSVKRVDDTYPLAFQQLQQDMHGRPLALTTTLAEYREHPTFTEGLKGRLPTLMPHYDLSEPQWAMTIDLSMCVGCSACVVACQAENNVLVVGKDQVRRGRAMHWLRIDTYSVPGKERGRKVHQPMLCQHCETAPCEYVCPVNATVHSPDGLNEMIYNRCVGTRFCSNNCPYKVRRFNWFDWTHRPYNEGEVSLQRNPEVTVRERGVMEKCTYCVQRIRAAEIRARKQRRAIQPYEVVTACQQACPTRAIQFGSLGHEHTPMTEWRAEPRSYFVLHETGARPRTMYLARVNNPNPELA